MSIVGAFLVPHPPAVFPEIGKDRAEALLQTSQALRSVSRSIAEMEPDTIVVFSPHAPSYGNYFHIAPGKAARGYLGLPEGPHAAANLCWQLMPRRFALVKADALYDVEYARQLAEASTGQRCPAGSRGARGGKLDVGTTVPLRFINESYSRYRLVRCSPSRLSPLHHYLFGKQVALVADALQRRTVVIASGDLSHRLSRDSAFGFAADAESFDRQVLDALETANFLDLMTMDSELSERSGECGLRPLVMLAGVLDGKKVCTDVLSYEKPFGVGHAVASFGLRGEDASRRFDRGYERWRRNRAREAREAEGPLAAFARWALEECVLSGQEPALGARDLERLAAEVGEEVLDAAASVFVTLRLSGHLRGSFGSLVAKKGTFAEELVRNAIGAGFQDVRFDRVRKDELPFLEYEVDVVASSERVGGAEDLDPRSFGVCAFTPRRKKCGVVLPNPQSPLTGSEQLAIALQKGGIDAMERYSIERFSTVRHR